MLQNIRQQAKSQCRRVFLTSPSVDKRCASDLKMTTSIPEFISGVDSCARVQHMTDVEFLSNKWELLILRNGRIDPTLLFQSQARKVRNVKSRQNSNQEAPPGTDETIPYSWKPRTRERIEDEAVTNLLDEVICQAFLCWFSHLFNYSNSKTE